MDDFLSFARGPLFTACLLFMLIGLFRHGFLRTRDLLRVRRRTPKRDVPWRQIFRASAGWAVPVRHFAGEVPVLTVSSVVFHVGLILVPLFLGAHVRLWERSLGISLPALGTGVSDVLTLTTIATGIVLFLVRILRKPARELSRFGDYLLLAIVLTPFVSGYLAVHPTGAPFTYRTLMLVHVLSANLLFLLVPVTKLAHVVLFPFDRLSGDIFWRLVPGAGARVSETLRGHQRGAEA